MCIPYVKLSKCNYRHCISNAYYNANSLIGYKLAYFRSAISIDIFNCDIMSSIRQRSRSKWRCH